MDTRGFADGLEWFRTERVWPEDREVLYMNNTKLVPLLRGEVPFDYSDVPFDLVYLWDRRWGIALATVRAAAQEVCGPVSFGLSALALYGADAFDRVGGCCRQFTESRAVSAFPTVAELRQAGASDGASKFFFEQTSPGLYHCKPCGPGKLFSELQDDDCVGADFRPAVAAAVGFAAACVDMFTTNSTAKRVAVLGAEPVDLSVPAGGCGLVVATSLTVDTHWIAHRWLADDHCLAMAVADLGSSMAVVPGPFRVRVPDGTDIVFYHDGPPGRERTHAVAVVGGYAYVQLQVGRGLSGMFLYCMTKCAPDGSELHPIKYSGVGTQQREVPTDNMCYTALLAYPHQRLDADATWLWLASANLRPDHELQDFSARRVSPGVWHVYRGPGIGVLAILHAVRAHYPGDATVVRVGSEELDIGDVVGATSLMAHLLVQSLPALADVDPAELDRHGCVLASSMAAILPAADKVAAKCLQAVGDCVLSLALAERIRDTSGTVQQYQELRSRVSNNSYLCARFLESRYLRAFADPNSAASPRTGAGAVEAIAGVVYAAAGMEAVRELMHELSI